MPVWIDATKLLWLALGALLGAFSVLLTLFVIMSAGEGDRGVAWSPPRPPAPPHRKSPWPTRW